MKDYIEPKKVAQPVQIKIGNIKSSTKFFGLNIAMTNSKDFLFGENLGRLSFLDSAKDMARGNWYELPYPINNFYGLLQRLGWIIGAPVYNINDFSQVYEMGVCSMPDDIGNFSIYFKHGNGNPIKKDFKGHNIFDPINSMKEALLREKFYIGGVVEETEYFTLLHDGKGKEINSIGNHKLLLDRCIGRAIEDASKYNEELALEWLKTATGLPFKFPDEKYINTDFFAHCKFDVKLQNGTTLLKTAEVWFGTNGATEDKEKKWHAQLLNK